LILYNNSSILSLATYLTQARDTSAENRCFGCNCVALDVVFY